MRPALSKLRLLLVVSILLIGNSAFAQEAANIAPQAPLVVAPNPFVSKYLAVETIGNGPDVLFLPGYGCSKEAWRAHAERFRDKYRVHLVQYAGFAGEPWHGTGNEYIQPLTKDLGRYIQESRLKQPAIIGHSMGSVLALMLAQQHPEAVGRAMSVDSLPIVPFWLGKKFDVEEAQFLGQQMEMEILAADDENFHTRQVLGVSSLVKSKEARSTIVDWVMASDRVVLGTALRELFALDLRPQLTKITTPVWLVYAADTNSGNPPEKAATIWKREYASLSGAKFVMVEQSRHFVMADQPEKLNGVIEEFLRDLKSPPDR